MSKTIYTIHDNLERTIKGKQEALDKMCSNNPYTIEFMSDGEVMAYRATVEFLRINIDELKRILADVEEVIVGVEDDLNRATDLSWVTNPDRQGGAFTQDEIDNTGWK